MCEACLNIHQSIPSTASHAVKPLADILVRAKQTIMGQVDNMSDNVNELDFIEENCSDAIARMTAQERDVSTTLREMCELYKHKVDVFFDEKQKQCDDFVQPIRAKLKRKLQTINTQKATCERITREIEALIDRNDNRLPTEGTRLVQEMQQCLGQTQSLDDLSTATLTLANSHASLDLGQMLSLSLTQSPLIEVRFDKTIQDTR